MLKFLIAPDFSPENFSGWHMFNTLLQHRSGQQVHLLMPADTAEEADMRAQGLPDLIYANPFDAAVLIRKYQYVPVVRPVGQSDEVVIATYVDAPYRHSDELPKNSRILAASNRDVRLIGLCLLESAGLDESGVFWLNAATFQAAARRLIRQEADAAFFLASAYDAFNDSTREQMRILMRSQLDDIYHMVLLHPERTDLYDTVLETFTGMHDSVAGRLILGDLALNQGFEKLECEDAEFMIDLMQTLQD